MKNMNEKEAAYATLFHQNIERLSKAWKNLDKAVHAFSGIITKDESTE